MDLNPDDIVGYHFKQSLRGYSVEEVDELLDRLADQVERMAAELADARARAEAAERQAASVRETEATLQRTLVVAQQAAERNLADAASQAEATVANAAAEAERLLHDAEEEATRRRSEAESSASEMLAEAQQLARREVDAARARVEQAASRHAEVLAAVAQHRDALRGHLSTLEDLALEPPPAPRADLIAGELPDQGPEHDHGPDAGHGPVADQSEQTGPDPTGATGPWPEPDEQVRPGADTAAPLTVRVHDGTAERTPEPPPVASDGRDGE